VEPAIIKFALVEAVQDADAAEGQHAALEAAVGPAALRGRLL
jgi:hypothetical protein